MGESGVVLPKTKRHEYEKSGEGREEAKREKTTKLSRCETDLPSSERSLVKQQGPRHAAMGWYRRRQTQRGSQGQTKCRPHTRQASSKERYVHVEEDGAIDTACRYLEEKEPAAARDSKTKEAAAKEGVGRQITLCFFAADFEKKD